MNFNDDDQDDGFDGFCEGCGLPTYGDGRYTDDDVYLCRPCFDEVPVVAEGRSPQEPT